MRINSVGKVGINSTAPDGMLAIEHTSSAPNLTMRNHPAAGPYTNLYGMELRHAFGSVQHGALIHTEEADLGRRSLDISDSDGVFCTFVMGRVGINTTRPTGNLDIRAKTDDNPSIRIYRPSGGGDVGSLSFASSQGTNCYINWRGGGGTKGLQFFTSANGNDGSTAERMRLNEDLNILDGNLVIGTAGHGIDFSAQSASSTGTTGDEVLNHYEEGTFTPILNFGGIGVPSYNAATNGTYTRIGRVIHFRCYVFISSKGGASGTALLYGLPFSNNSGSRYAALSTFTTNMELGAPHVLVAYVANNTSYAAMVRYDNTSGDAQTVNNTHFNDNSEFMLAGSYFT